MTIRLMIIDDHELVRAGLVQFLGSSPGIEIVAEAASGNELLEKLRTTQADLLLLDMTMPGENGADLISHIKKIYPDILIMVLSMHDEANMVMSAIKAGASGYIHKSSSPQTLPDAIRKVIATGTHPAVSHAKK